ncbi:MAG TPA: hypothetical protein VGE64_03120 [Xanthomonadaceae bacterium]
MANHSMAITSARRLRDADLPPCTIVQRKTLHKLQNDHDHGIGHGPEAGNADNNSDLRVRLNAKHRFAIFMMARALRARRKAA